MIPAIEDLPQATCSECGKSKIMGLFTPLEISSGSLRCRMCIGEINRGARSKMVALYQPAAIENHKKLNRQLPRK